MINNADTVGDIIGFAGMFMYKIREYILVLMLGAIMYGLIEIVWRGYTHWSMVITGGICFLLVYRIAMLDSSLLLRSFAGAAVITAIEFAVGVTVNIVFKLDVWDYSDMPLNLFGQICPLYSLFWFLLCLIAIPLCKNLKSGFRRTDA